MRRLFILGLVLSLLALGGCPLIAGTIDSVSKLGIRADDRVNLLPQAVKKFYDACYWGNGTAVLRFIAPSEQERLRAVAKVSPDKIRFVESRIEDVVFSENSYEATVTSQVKYFEVPYYIVKNRMDTQHWKFSISDGWLLYDMQSSMRDE